MTFTSFTFVLFFLVFFVLYWSFRNHLRVQNYLILAGSYLFYGWWDYRFLALIFASSMIDYTLGLMIYKSNNQKMRNLFMGLCLFTNLGLLFYFKYYNFFIDSFSGLLTSLNIDSTNLYINVILPVGISFYTFQTLSYSLDIYRNKLTPTTNLVDFLGFVSFFPQLVAGPIERAGMLLPQICKPRTFNYEVAASGARLILYGFFKKLVIADPLSLRVTEIFNNPEAYSSAETVIGAMFFLIQLYLDFSAYSDIAIGTARILGFQLMKNFDTPLFATSVPEFWRRWHISLTTWFRDYLFLPLVKLKFDNTAWRVFSTIILFVIIGIWHGANITFVYFGFIMGLCFIPTLMSKNNPSLKKIIKFFNNNKIGMPVAAFATFSLISLVSVLFRAENIKMAVRFYNNILYAGDLWQIDEYIHRMIPLIIGFFVFEFYMRKKMYCFDISMWPKWIRYSTYTTMTLSILIYGYFADEPFYYFQF
jgi:alginate O-acetyltransferase complex protein AlgI